MKVFLFCAPKSIKIDGRATKLQSVEKWCVYISNIADRCGNTA